MLRELVHNKIDEIFLEMQKANNITNGDIDPWDAQRLDHVTGALYQTIKDILECQKGGIIE